MQFAVERPISRTIHSSCLWIRARVGVRVRVRVNTWYAPWGMPWSFSCRGLLDWAYHGISWYVPRCHGFSHVVSNGDGVSHGLSHGTCLERLVHDTCDGATMDTPPCVNNPWGGVLHAPLNIHNDTSHGRFHFMEYTCYIRHGADDGYCHAIYVVWAMRAPGMRHETISFTWG